MRIYICAHQIPVRRLHTPLFRTLVSGAPPADDGSYLSDLTGTNIAHDNRLSELRHQYFVWKNFPPDTAHVGFEHYRRAFFLPATVDDRFPQVQDLQATSATFGTHHFLVSRAVFDQHAAWRAQLAPADIATLDTFDMIIPRPEFASLRQQFDAIFDPVMPGAWHRLLAAAAATALGRACPALAGCDPHLCYWLNMYILKRDIFAEYMTFAFEALALFEASAEDALLRAPRTLGHMTERLFSIYVWLKRMTDPAIRVLELPTIWHKTELDPDHGTISHDLRFELSQAEARGAAK